MILPPGSPWALKLARRKEGITEKHFAVVQIFLSAGNNIRFKLHIYKILERTKERERENRCEFVYLIKYPFKSPPSPECKLWCYKRWYCLFAIY